MHYLYILTIAKRFGFHNSQESFKKYIPNGLVLHSVKKPVFSQPTHIICRSVRGHGYVRLKLALCKPIPFDYQAGHYLAPDLDQSGSRIAHLQTITLFCVKYWTRPGLQGNRGPGPEHLKSRSRIANKPQKKAKPGPMQVGSGH